MNKQTREILTAVFKELKAMSREEFFKELELNGEGDIASFLLESGALEVRVAEAEAFAHPSSHDSIFAAIDCKTITIGASAKFQFKFGQKYQNNADYGLIGKSITDSMQTGNMLLQKITNPDDRSIKEDDAEYAIAC